MPYGIADPGDDIMTIGFLLNTCEPFYRGGYERRAWSFARELARRGHDVRIYTSCPRDETIEGVRFVRLAPPRRFFNDQGVRNGIADLLFTLAIARLLWRVKRKELDVLDVCATPFLHLPLVALIAWLKRIPVVLTCHEALLAELPAYARERGHRGRLATWALPRLLALVYRVGMGLFQNRLAVSHRTARALAVEKFPSFATVEFGLETAALASTFPETASWENAVHLIFCGRLTPIKSVDQTLTALFALRRQTGPFHFHIVGEGSERARLEEMVAEAGAGDYVTFHGELSEDDKRRILTACEVFVLSSPREGFSIATLEAMAQGCAAVVVSDPARPNGALDFVRPRQEGLCVPPGLGEMREVLREIIENNDERRAFRFTAWQTAQEYRIDRQAERLLTAYANAVPGAKPQCSGGL
jgi:glycosyltransferase involved in cell wall biosynthesis